MSRNIQKKKKGKEMKKMRRVSYNAERVVMVMRTFKFGIFRMQCLITGIAIIPSPNETAWNHTSGPGFRG